MQITSKIAQHQLFELLAHQRQVYLPPSLQVFLLYGADYMVELTKRFYKCWKLSEEMVVTQKNLCLRQKINLIHSD